MITISIDTNKDENCSVRNLETIRILKDLIKTLEENSDMEWNYIPLKDFNNNIIGSYSFNPLK